MSGVVIYEIKCLVNGKRYVGSTSRFEKRKERHFYNLRKGVSDHPPLQNDFDKYGRAQFKMRPLLICGAETRYMYEQLCMDFYQTYTAGYNSYRKALGTCSEDFTPERREKIGAGQRGRKHTLEHRQKVGAFNRGKKLSEEHKAKIRLSNQLAVTPERLAKMRAPKTPEIKARMSAAAKKRWATQKESCNG